VNHTWRAGTTTATLLAATLIVLMPFGEGGRTPLALAAGQILALGFVFAVFATARDRHLWIQVLVILVAMLSVSFVSAAGAPYRYAALLGLMDRLAIAAAFTGALLHFGDAAGLRRLRLLLVASCSVQAACALALAAVRGAAGAAGLFQNRSHLGAFLAFGLALAAGALLETPDGRESEVRVRMAWLAAAAIQAAALVLLQSRGALLGAGAAAAALLYVHGPTLPGRRRAVAAAAIVAILAAGAFALHRRFASSDDPDRYTRVSIWRAALVMTAEHPWLGFGPGQFPHQAPRFNFPLDRSPVRFGRGFRGAHSLPLTLAAEDGLPVAALAVGFACAILVTLLKRRPAGAGAGGAGPLVATAGAALLTIATQGLVEDLQERPAIMLAAALLAGSALSCARRGAAPGETHSHTVRGLRGAGRFAWLSFTALLCAWIAAAGVLFPYLGWREAERARSLGREGLPHMRLSATLVPADAAPHRDLAMAQLQGGPPDARRYAAAAIELEAARSDAPRDATLALLRARLEAIAATRIFPGGPAAARAAALYDEAAGLAPTDPRPRFEASGYFDSQGLHEEAIDRLRDALRLEPHYRRARLALIDLLARAGRDEEARREASELGRSDRLLRDYSPDSPYAQEITADDPVRRASIPASLLAATL
jgi:O-antigen ligase/tetratricopeptide (TPR) repeat protein